VKIMTLVNSSPRRRMPGAARGRISHGGLALPERATIAYCHGNRCPFLGLSLVSETLNGKKYIKKISSLLVTAHRRDAENGRL